MPSGQNSESIFFDKLDEDTLAVLHPAQCPRCRGSVWRARRGPVGNPEGQEVFLSIGSLPLRAIPRRGSIVAVVSPPGRIQVVDPIVFELHVCNPQLTINRLGDYSPEVLAHSCPVEFCLVGVDEFCISPRGDVIDRPHGARKAVAYGHPWVDEDVIAPLPEDES